VSKWYLVETFLHPSLSHEHFLGASDWHLGASLKGSRPGARKTSREKYFLVSSAVRMFWQVPVALAHSDGSKKRHSSAISKMFASLDFMTEYKVVVQIQIKHSNNMRHFLGHFLTLPPPPVGFVIHLNIKTILFDC
jgi:hypothetical protein